MLPYPRARAYPDSRKKAGIWTEPSRENLYSTYKNIRDSVTRFLTLGIFHESFPLSPWLILLVNRRICTFAGSSSYPIRNLFSIQKEVNIAKVPEHILYFTYKRHNISHGIHIKPQKFNLWPQLKGVGEGGSIYDCRLPPTLLKRVANLPPVSSRSM
jgi:hypothetical protein